MLAAAAALEYVFPPFPGDTVSLFGTFLAATAGYRVALVYAVLTLGAMAGSLAPYGLGRFLGRSVQRWPAFLRGERTSQLVRRVASQFERRGATYLIVNRFLPAFRGVFFVAAGLARLPVGKVLLYGGISAALWNSLILAIGYAVGRNWEALLEFSRTYARVSIAVVAAAIAAWVFVAAQRRRAARSEHRDRPHESAETGGPHAQAEGGDEGDQP